MQMKKWIPWMMVAVRAALGPVVMLGERCRWNGIALAVIVLGALLSDIFDGVLARRWKTDTAALRLSDSMADTVFYLCVAAGIALDMPAVWQECRGGVLVVLGCEALRFALDFVKYGKPASYHSYLAKMWGLVLATAVIVTFATQRVSMWMSAAVVLGVLSNAESLAMSIVLPEWRRDIKTWAVAWRLRTGLLREQVKPGAAIGTAMVLGLLFLGGGMVRAQSLEKVIYVGGTVLQGTGLHGKVSVSSNDTLVFEGPSKIVVPYDHVISYESTNHKKVHVGLLTEGIWRLVAPWPEAKRISLSYRDPDEHLQVVELEMSREDERLLVEVLKTRVPRSMPGPTAPLIRPSAMVQERTADH
jgi:phosphatidylglycerophosphate synthase